MPSLDVTKDLAIIVAGLIALVTFAYSTLESVRRGRQERAENFVAMRRRFLETPEFRAILNYLAQDDAALAELPVQERRNFIGFLEEVALMVNSRLIRPEVAHYMFGYYVMLTARSRNLWAGLDHTSEYWTLFRKFARDMGAYETPTEIRARDLSF